MDREEKNRFKALECSHLHDLTGALDNGKTEFIIEIQDFWTI